MKLKPEQLHQLINELVASSDSLSDVLLNLFNISDLELDKQDFKFIDQSIFLCEECGWWCPIKEQRCDEYENYVCVDCLPKE